jgi:uncharacterized protein with NRDE domain
MCLVAVGIRVCGDVPLVIGANREEHYRRGGTVPKVSVDSYRFVAGLDPAAGGTWLGVNEFGVVIAVANRKRERLPDSARSRGLLVRDLLSCRDMSTALSKASEELRTDRYTGCNLLCADGEGATVLHAADHLRSRSLEAGWHVFTAHDVDDESDPRIAYSLRFLREGPAGTAETTIELLKRLCSDRRDPPMCLHGQEGGTVSSSIIACGERREKGAYWHCQGPPDENPYVDYSYLLWSLQG